MKKTNLLLTTGALLLSLATFAEGVKPIKENFSPKGTFSKTKYVKVAAIAINPIGVSPVPASPETAEAVKMRNRKAIENQVREAAKNGAEIIVSPEFGINGYPDIAELPSEEDNYRTPEDVKPYVELPDGPTFQYFSKLSKELKVFIHYGLAIQDPKTGHYHNAVQVVDPDGKLALTYYKMHLFEIEHNYLSEGTEVGFYNSPVGKMGIMICSDTYGSEVIQGYRNIKVDAVSISTSWARYNSGMDQFRSTARQVGVPMIAANQMYYPDSGVINADGTNQSHIRQSSGIAYGYFLRKNTNTKVKVKVKQTKIRK